MSMKDMGGILQVLSPKVHEFLYQKEVVEEVYSLEEKGRKL